MQNNEVNVSWGASVPSEVVHRILGEYNPFKDWVASMNKPNTIARAKVKGIHIQNVDLFGSRIGFVKFRAHVVDENNQPIAGIIFMRGPSVAILVILKLSEEGSPDHGKEFTIVTVQARIPIGETDLAEIPAGMLDGGQFAGAAARELKEETGIDIKEEELFDLTQKAYNNSYGGIYPSAGGCDELIRLFLYRTTVNREQLNGYQNKLTGLREDGENITLKVLPLDRLWKEAPDAKALSALCIYNALKAEGILGD